MWDRNPIRTSIVHMLPAVAGRHGLALAPLLARAGLATDETFAGGIVARAQVCTLLLHLERQAGEPTIGLDLAAAADPARLAMAGPALFAGRTLRECLASLERQMPSLQGGVAFRLYEQDRVAHWCHRMADSDIGHARVLNEGIAAFMVHAMRAIVGIDPAQLGVALPHRAQAPARIYEEKLGARLAFGAGDGIVLTFDAGWLDRPNLLFDGFLAAGAAEDPIAGGPVVAETVWLNDDALLEAITRLIQSSALAGALSLADTARSLGISPRSLQRRLALLGTTFEAYVDAWRSRQARVYLADPGLPIGSVARALGYSDPAHFVRAFRRWEGQAPIAFRRAAGLDGGATSG
ncbi:MAG: helix-turn-helix domain-containing protein [Alphaproteobacteria bacterium]